MKKTAILILAIFLASAGICSAEQDDDMRESNRFLLFGLAVKPSVTELKNSWVIGEGRDYHIYGGLLAGYEIGLYHRFHEDRTEYRFKTFLNLKTVPLRMKNVRLFFGGGAGLLEVLRVTELEHKFHFNLGIQGVFGFEIGAIDKDRFCVQVHAVNSGGESGDFQIHLMAGVRY